MFLILTGRFHLNFHKVDIFIYHIIYKSSNRNKVRDKFGITYFEKLITMQIRSRD